MARPVYFELHIRPMFRLLDRIHMDFFGDLTDYDQMMEKRPGDDSIRADIVLQTLKSTMPPATHGGPWPAEWVILYERWKKEGYKRLTPGIAVYLARRSGSSIRVRASGTAPAPGYTVWLDYQVYDFNQDAPKVEFALLLEPPAAKGSGSSNFIFEERITNAPHALHELTIVDKAGRHIVPIE